MIPVDPINLKDLIPLGDAVALYSGEYDGALLIVMEVAGGKMDGIKYYIEVDQEAAVNLREAINMYLEHRSREG